MSDTIQPKEMAPTQVGGVVLAKMMMYRAGKIDTLQQQIHVALQHMYTETNDRRRARTCTDLRRMIDQLHKLVLKNADDASNLENAILVLQSESNPEKSVEYIW